MAQGRAQVYNPQSDLYNDHLLQLLLLFLVNRMMIVVLLYVLAAAVVVVVVVLVVVVEEEEVVVVVAAVVVVVFGSFGGARTKAHRSLRGADRPLRLSVCMQVVYNYSTWLMNSTVPKFSKPLLSLIFILILLNTKHYC